MEFDVLFFSSLYTFLPEYMLFDYWVVAVVTGIREEENAKG